MDHFSMSRLISVTLFCCVLLMPMTMHGQIRHFNKAWWDSAPHVEQEGFIWGFFDCPSAPKLAAGSTTADDYIKYLDKVTGISKQGHDDIVPQALRRAHTKIVGRPTLKGGEVYKEKHGFLDGDWWGDKEGQMPDERLGYVEGYLACEFNRADLHHAALYVKLLNRHFALPANENDKIADALQPLIDLEKHKN